MQGQLGNRDMEQEINDTFAVFRSDVIDSKLLKLMVQVSAFCVCVCVCMLNSVWTLGWLHQYDTFLSYICEQLHTFILYL
jgi:hypothetical protein